ncbi:hypothetical protein V1278_002037 [Bradyrhizobium sp. AZCC 1577]
MATDVQLSEVARYGLWRRQLFGQAGRRNDRQQTPDSGFRSGGDRPGLQALDAASNGTVEMCHTVLYYCVGKDPTFAVYASVPFGLNARRRIPGFISQRQRAGHRIFQVIRLDRISVWQHECADGRLVPQGDQDRCRSTGIEDARRRHLGTRACADRRRAQQLAGGGVYPALEKGAVDAAEWIGPYDDEKLGFQKVAKYYYCPGFWDGGPTVTPSSIWKNGILCQDLSGDPLQCRRQHKYLDGRALRHAESHRAQQLIANGTQLRPFNEVLDACLKSAKRKRCSNLASPSFELWISGGGRRRCSRLQRHRSDAPAIKPAASPDAVKDPRDPTSTASSRSVPPLAFARVREVTHWAEAM